MHLKWVSRACRSPTCPLDALRDSSHLRSITTLSMSTRLFRYTSLESGKLDSWTITIKWKLWITLSVSCVHK